MSMSMRYIGAAVLSGAVLLTPAFLQAQGSAEVFTATATVKTAAGATATAPLELTITRKMPQGEADVMINAFKAGGAAALKKALVGVAPTGTVKIGSGAAVPTRLTVERVTGRRQAADGRDRSAAALSRRQLAGGQGHGGL